MEKQHSERFTGFGLPKMLIKADMFPAPIPQFNSKGKNAIKTYFGGFISFISYYLFFLFAMVKFEQLITRHNPQIVEYLETNALGATDEYNLGDDSGFMIAVGLVHFLTGETLNDPRYLKWINAYTSAEGGVYIPKQAHMMRPCTEEDYEKFNPPDMNAALIVEQLKKDGALFCLDANLLKTQAIRGNHEVGDFRFVDVMAMPCHTRETVIGGTVDNIRDDCVRDQEAFYAYLDNMSTVIWYNYSVLKHNKFEIDERVQHFSGITKYKTKLRENTWRKASLHYSNLVDETDFFQWGQYDEVEFQRLDIEGINKPSSYNKWPSYDQPDNRYKISSVVIVMDQDISQIERATYSGLDWLGDVGGLFDGMRIIGGFIVYPVAAFSLKAELVG